MTTTRAELPPMTEPGDERFPRAYRLRRSADFQRVFQQRVSAGDQRLVLYAWPNGLPYSRLGLSVSRRVGGAVVRNRWKRLLREAFRHERHRLPPGLDLVAIPRAAAQPTLAGLQESLLRLSGRLARRIKSR